MISCSTLRAPAGPHIEQQTSLMVANVIVYMVSSTGPMLRNNPGRSRDN